jgi:hypothetical protein
MTLGNHYDRPMGDVRVLDQLPSELLMDGLEELKGRIAVRTFIDTHPTLSVSFVQLLDHYHGGLELGLGDVAQALVDICPSGPAQAPRVNGGQRRVLQLAGQVHATVLEIDRQLKGLALVLFGVSDSGSLMI